MIAAGNLFKIFGRSPIRPLQKHMRKGLDTVITLRDFFSAAQQQNWEAASKHQAHICDLENQADDIKKDIRSHLPKNLFLPIPREDVLGILSIQDAIPNKTKDIAGLVLGRKMALPETILSGYAQLLEYSITAVDQAHQAIDELDELLQSGFSLNEVELLNTLINAVSQSEHESDEQQIKVRKALFAIEDSLSPVDVIFLYKVISWTGEIADLAEHVANRIQLIIAR